MLAGRLAVPHAVLPDLSVAGRVRQRARVAAARYREWAPRARSQTRSLAERMRAADAEYRARRAAAGGWRRPDSRRRHRRSDAIPLATKCLHAHVAAYSGRHRRSGGRGAARRAHPSSAPTTCVAACDTSAGESMTDAAARRLAAIDIGTVTTRLLVADVDLPGPIREVERSTDITHLGENLTQSGQTRVRRRWSACATSSRATHERVDELRCRGVGRGSDLGIARRGQRRGVPRHA